jgi:hypothetical protein
MGKRGARKDSMVTIYCRRHHGTIGDRAVVSCLAKPAYYMEYRRLSPGGISSFSLQSC